MENDRTAKSADLAGSAASLVFEADLLGVALRLRTRSYCEAELQDVNEKIRCVIKMPLRRSLRILVVSAVTVCTSAVFPNSVHATPPQYSITILGPINGNDSLPKISKAYGINASGQVAGIAPYLNTITDAVRWTGSTALDLGTVANVSGYQSKAWSINASGQVAGDSHTGGSVVNWHAVRWTGNTPTDLGTLGGIQSGGRGINASGQVAGWSNTLGKSDYNAVRWTGTAPTKLGGLGSTTVGESINDSGVVAGYSYHTGLSAYHAVRWTDTTPTDLGTLGGKESKSYGINASGQVAGYSYLTGDNVYHAVIWTGTIPSDLGTLGGLNSVAVAINDAGDVVGWSNTTDNSIVPFLYTGGVMYNLKNLIVTASTYTQIEVGGTGSGFNNIGQIAATGTTVDGYTDALRLDPTNIAVITLLVNPTNGGSVAGGGTFTVGSQQQLSATPAENYMFTSWNDGSTANPRTVTVPSGGATYTATFTKQTAALSIVASPAAGGTVTGNGTFDVGSQQQISATASTCYVFTGWNDGNTDNPRLFHPAVSLTRRTLRMSC